MYLPDKISYHKLFAKETGNMETNNFKNTHLSEVESVFDREQVINYELIIIY